MKRLVYAVVCLVWLAFGLLSGAGAQGYTILGSGWAQAINDSGQVVGQSSGAFLWKNGVTTNLSCPSGDDGPAANDISDNGQIAGFCSIPYTPDTVACFWQNGAFTALPNLMGCSTGIAFGVNLNGLNVGACQNNAGKWLPCLWQNGTCTGLPLLPGSNGPINRACAINDSGQIVGWSGSEACLWQNGTPTDLGAGEAFDINDCGQVVGVHTNSAGITEACLWQNGTCTGFGVPTGYAVSIAQGINDAGQAVGYAYNQARTMEVACLWENGRCTDTQRSAGIDQQRCS